MDLGLRGQRVLVTAASRGIGYALASAFLAVGQLARAGEVHGVVADLASEHDLDRLVEESRAALGGLDVLAYVTGSPPAGTVLEQSYASWEGAARLLTISPAYLGQRVAASMIADGTAGRLVFLSSFAIREPGANLALSNVCRIAVAGLVRSLARELGPHRIRVNGVLPGYIATDRLNHLFEDAARRKGGSVEEAREAITREVPLGRIGSPDELAQSVLFLASERSSYISGAMLPVDGGLLRSVG